MSREEREQSIQRILVALDTSPASLEAVETAAELADSFGAELIGPSLVRRGGGSSPGAG